MIITYFSYNVNVMATVKELFCKNLKSLIDEARIKPEKLATDLKISSGRISLYLNGKNMPSVETLIKLADYFGVSTDYLLGRKDF